MSAHFLKHVHTQNIQSHFRKKTLFDFLTYKNNNV